MPLTLLRSILERMNSRSASALLVAVALAAIVAVLWPRAGPEPQGAQGARSSERGNRGLSGRSVKLADPSAGAAAPLERSAAQEGALELRVTASGLPVPGASVQLYARGPRDLSTGKVEWRIASAGSTGKDGALRLPAPSGSYLVAARAQGFAPARREVTRPLGERLTKVALELAEGSSLRGRTVSKGAKAEPVPLCQITLTYGGTSASLRAPVAPPEEEVRATSDERGQFQIDGLAPGHYHLEARAAGFGSVRRSDLLLPHAEELLVELPAASFIEGYVLGKEGRPAAGAEVFAAGSTEETALSTESGSFSLEVAPRTYHLQARRGTEAGAADAPVVVAAGATARGIKIVLGASGAIAGIATSASTGQPLAGISVAISPHSENGDSGRSVSDAAGAFAISRLAPGSYDVDARGTGWVAEERRGLVISAGARFELRLEFRATGSAQGVVRDSAGRAIAGAIVRGGLDRDNSLAEARTDESGAYQLTGLPSGRTPVQARRGGSLGGELAELEIPEGRSVEHDFTLADEGTLTGTVSRAAGKPLEKPLVLRLFPASGRRAGLGPEDTVVPVDGSGVFSSTLQAGAYSLIGLYVGGARATSPALVTIDAGQTTVKDLTLNEPDAGPAGLTGQVLEPDGTPSPLAQVRLFSAAQGRFFMATSADESGQFHIDRPRADLPDSLEVQAQNGGRSGRITLGAAETLALVQLRPGATVRGRVLSSGAPVRSITVAVRAAVGHLGGQQTLEFSGDQYQLRDLSAGPLELSVQTRDGRSGEGQITVAAGEAAQLDLTLVASASVTGRVVDAETQAPVAGAFISLDGANADDSESGQDGRFTLGALSPEGHSLSAFAPLYVVLSKSFALQPGQALDLGDLPLNKNKPQPGTIGVMLRGDSEGVLVTFLQQGGPADQAGIRLGDAVAAVDGQPVQGVDDARVRIRGAPGTPVLLTLSRNGTQRVVQVVRAG